MQPTMWYLWVGVLALAACVSVTNAAKDSDKCGELDCAQCLAGDRTNMTKEEKQWCVICKTFACKWILKWTPKKPLRTECKKCYCKRDNLVCKNTCHPYSDKEGKCPAIWEQAFVEMGINKTCSDDCDGDYSCDGRMKCCQSRCGRKCLMPTGCRYKDKFAMTNGQMMFLDMKICTCNRGMVKCGEPVSTPYLKQLLKQAKEQV